MTQEWQIHRRLVAQADAQRRWDLAYQCLLQWAQNPEAADQAPIKITPQEEQNASSSVCPCIHPTASATPDD